MPTPTDPGRAPGWYKDAVIYQMHVRAYQDANQDGVGDFAGLVQRLDYIRDLGVTTIWLLPFYPSPLRDDGYDIAHFTEVHPSYGTLREFKTFLKEAHARDLRVLCELVLNHTSDRHEWFQKSRRAPPGSQWRDVYVWSDTPQRYAHARIIFKDFESSNWEWDPLAGAYYWHRFYKHQPDLNYESPFVREMMLGVLDFWMELGVDGARLDAVPYLFERDGTSCDNLPETHAFLRTLRKHLDEKFDSRALLAEANQWPEDAAEYFGGGQECHMNFHFPLMPRLFMAVQREDRFPIVDILEQTPEIPPECQWALFLRNHDELTLEMVTDEDRDYMYRSYAEDPRARINLGIRRRLAPLLGNDRRRIELLNGLLFSLPGTPIVYYGDEIGMGDNIYLGDRDGVRTPMQWSPDRNAGFSRVNPQRLYLPVIIDSESHYNSVNVEAQERSPQSLLWWMRRLIALRKQFRVFGRGTIEFLFPENAKILVFVRQLDGESILVIANLSRFAQYAECDLSRFRGMTPIEMFGWTSFPPIGELPYLFTLAPHAFHWFLLTPQLEPAKPLAHDALPAERVTELWPLILQGRKRTRCEAAITAWLRRRAGDAIREHAVQSVELIDAIPVGGRRGLPAFILAVLDIRSASDQPERMALPLAWAGSEHGARLVRENPELVMMRLTVGSGEEGILFDAGQEMETAETWLDTLRQGGTLNGSHYKLLSRRSRKLSSGAEGKASATAARSLSESGVRRLASSVRVVATVDRAAAEQLTNIVLGDEYLLEVYRHLDAGVSVDWEMTRFLERAGFERLLPIEGMLELKGDDASPATVALLKEYVAHQGTAWSYARHEFGAFMERMATPNGDESRRPRSVPDSLSGCAEVGPTPELLDLVGPFLRDAEQLGACAAEMHTALASATEDPAFSPEPFSLHYQRSVYQGFRTLTRQTLRRLQRQLKSLPPQTRARAEAILQAEARLLERFQQITGQRIEAQRIRCHGNYRLSNLLHDGRDFIAFDFNGNLRVPVSERRIKRSPLHDVAMLLNSICSVTLFATEHGEGIGVLPAHAARHAWGGFWYRAVGGAFLRSYLRDIRTLQLLPDDSDQMHAMLDAYLLESALRNLNEELRGIVVLHDQTVARVEELLN